MKRNYSLVLMGMVSAAFLLTACEGRIPSATIPSDAEVLAKKKEARVSEAGYFEGQVQVRLGGDEAGELEAFVGEMAAQGVVLSAMDKINNRPIYLFEYSSPFELDEVVSKVKESGRVESASPNYHLTSNELSFNDPELWKQWSLNNHGQEAPGALAGRPGADIGLSEVDAEGSEDVVVAIVDTGVDFYHEDLSETEMVDGSPRILGGNIWTNPGEIPGNNKNDDNNRGDMRDYVDDVHGYDFYGYSGDASDDHGHGTHIAGVIGALRDNFIGIAGMNRKVKMMSLKFLGPMGGSDFDAQQAIYYLIDLKERFPEKRFLMNCSWGSSGRSARRGDADDHLLYAFRQAAEADILTVAAAGNSALSNNFSDSFPANYTTRLDEFISVAATNNVDGLADFSSYGSDTVDVAAPGVLIYSTLPGDRYAAWSGTSMAAPHVAGLAALVWAENPDLSAAEVRDRIVNTSDILPQLKGYVISNGRINVARALANDINVGLDPVEEEVAKTVKSPSIKSGSIDHVTTITEEGAREISVCFESINMSGMSDWIQVYGSDYRVRDMITGTWLNQDLDDGDPYEICTAPVPGDSIHLRFFSGGFAGMGMRGFVTESVKVVR